MHTANLSKIPKRNSNSRMLFRNMRAIDVFSRTFVSTAQMVRGQAESALYSEVNAESNMSSIHTGEHSNPALVNNSGNPIAHSPADDEIRTSTSEHPVLTRPSSDQLPQSNKNSDSLNAANLNRSTSLLPMKQIDQRKSNKQYSNTDKIASSSGPRRCQTVIGRPSMSSVYSANASVIVPPHLHRITINVSGLLFETRLSTLNRFPETLLGNSQLRQTYFDPARNQFFFDRHRESFQAILYYYQSRGRVWRPADVPVDTFYEELIFFRFGKSVLRQFRINEGYPFGELSDDENTEEKTDRESTKLVSKDTKTSDAVKFENKNAKQEDEDDESRKCCPPWRRHLPCLQTAKDLGICKKNETGETSSCCNFYCSGKSNRHPFFVKGWTFLENPDSSIYARIFCLISMLVISISIINFCVETLPQYGFYEVSIERPTPLNNSIITSTQKSSIKNGRKNSNNFISLTDARITIMRSESISFKNGFFIVESFCISWFVFELAARFVCSPKKLLFCKGILNLVDFIAVLPYFITLITMIQANSQRRNPTMLYAASSSSSSKKNGADGLAVLRIFRLVRVFRILKFSRHSAGLQILGKTIQSSVKELVMLMFFLLICVVLFSSAVYYADLEQEASTFNSIPDAFWWALITMTTVGYGDMRPVSTMGKLIGSACAIAGVLTIALPVPVIVSNFNFYYQRHKMEISATAMPTPQLKISTANSTSSSSNCDICIDEEVKDSDDYKFIAEEEEEESVEKLKMEDVNTIEDDEISEESVNLSSVILKQNFSS